MILDYIVNLSIFSLLVSTPLVMRSFLNGKPLKQVRLLVGIYAGIVTSILILMSIHIQGYSFDIRYAPVILVFSYAGPLAGLITGIFAIVTRLLTADNWYPAISGWVLMMLSFSLIHVYTTRLSPAKRSAILYGAYVLIYIMTVPIIFKILRDNPFFHFQYIVFVMIGVFIGSLLIESYEKLYRTNATLTEMYSVVASYQDELKYTLEEFQGGIFKVRKTQGSYIHNFAEGIFFNRKATANANSLPIDFIQVSEPYFEKAWLGNEVQFEVEWPEQHIALVSLRPIKEGDKVKEVIGTAVDITEKKKMEKSLEASEFKYRLIAENTSDLIMLMNQEKALTYLSPSHASLLGFDLSELQHIDWYDLIHSEDVHFVKETIRELYDHKLPQSLEFRIKHKDGRSLYIETRGVPVLNSSRQIEHIVFISRDVSERKKSEEFLLQSEKLSIVGELAAGVAHEIRNPLTTIKGFVQLYKNENYSIEFTDLLLSELERIESITSELLSLGKPQAVQLNRANLHQLIENTLELLLPQALMSGIQFRFTAEEMDFYAICEKNQLRQVFLNILKNAMEAMPGGGEIQIHLCKGENEECFVSFQDQGSGIPEDLLPRLGEPFYSLKEKGTGLGLMICNKIIKQHQGSISYYSKVNEGTRVTIRLPLIVNS